MYRQVQDGTSEIVGRRRTPAWWRLLSVTIVALTFGVLLRATLLLAAPAAVPAAATSTQSVPDHGGDDHGHGEHDKEYTVTYGIVIALPEVNNGTLVISNNEEISFTVTITTDYDDDINVGECVEVKALKSDPSVAVKVDDKDLHDCNGKGHDHDDDDDHHKGHAYGIVNSIPDGRVGQWDIGGTLYTATERTEFDFDHGRLRVGVCAKVEFRRDNPTVALEIESEKSYKCERDGNNNAHATVFGAIELLPPDPTNGIWVVGGISVTVTSATELISKGVPFTEGQVVKVKFITDLDGTNLAQRIEFKFGPNNPCRQFDAAAAGAMHDDDKRHRFFGNCPGSEGRATGIIDQMPADGAFGDWVIGGIRYQTNAFTVLRTEDRFIVGDRVRVEYVVLNDNTRLATKIAKVRSSGNPNASVFAGTVDAKPDGFVGDWTIGGAPFVAISDTIFIERGALFAVGSYVVVEYEITNDQRVIHKIVTYIPPGGGDENTVGILEAFGAASVASAEESLQGEEVWTIGGVNFIVSEATLLVENGEPLAVGTTVSVNSYTEDGQRYATMIRSQSGTLFIPMAAR
jgi:hypothetical protein